jgi:hypothetical protein
MSLADAAPAEACLNDSMRLMARKDQARTKQERDLVDGEITALERRCRTDDVRPAAYAPPPLRALDGLTLVKFDWTMGGFGNIPIANFTAKSTNEWTSKDIEFTCTTTGQSGTALSTVHVTVYEAIPAKTTKVLPDKFKPFLTLEP